MVKILVLGATGYIGRALCASLLRSSHVVYGLARTPEKAQQLLGQEILPVTGSIPDASGDYLELIRTHNIDVVIDCAGANQESYSILRDLSRLGLERLEAQIAAGVGAGGSPKLGFVYASGTWVHGSSTAPGVNDLSPVGVAGAPSAPPRLVAWRPELERAILASRDTLDVAVVRPALVYGREASLLSLWLDPIAAAAKAKDAQVNVSADPDAYLSFVHIDDAALGLHRAIEKLPLLSGTGVYPVFDLVTSRESLKDIILASAKVLEYEGEVKMTGSGDDLFAEAMNTAPRLDSDRARSILGWQPGQTRGLLERVEVTVKAFLACQGR